MRDREMNLKKEGELEETERKKEKGRRGSTRG